MLRRHRFRHWLARWVLGSHFEDDEGCWCERRDESVPGGAFDISNLIAAQSECNDSLGLLLSEAARDPDRDFSNVTYRWVEDEISST